MRKKERKPFTRPGQPNDPLEDLLFRWGEQVRETASYRERRVTIPREQLYREMERPYRLWGRVFRFGVVATMLLIGFVVWREWHPPEQPPSTGKPVAELQAPSPTVALTYPTESPGPPGSENFRQRLTMLLRSIEGPHSQCPGDVTRLNFKREYRAVQNLSREMHLLDPEVHEGLSSIVERLSVVLEPCLPPDKAAYLTQWVRHLPRKIYLTELP